MSVWADSADLRLWIDAPATQFTQSLPLGNRHLGAMVVSPALTPPTSFKFDFGPGRVAPGYTQVLPTTIYSKELGYGFEPGSTVACVERGKDVLRGDVCTSDKPFFFSVALAEGNYNVTVTFGDAAAATTTTVKAELRRLMLEKVETALGKFVTRTFTRQRPHAANH